MHHVKIILLWESGRALVAKYINKSHISGHCWCFLYTLWKGERGKMKKFIVVVCLALFMSGYDAWAYTHVIASTCPTDYSALTLTLPAVNATSGSGSGTAWSATWTSSTTNGTIKGEACCNGTSGTVGTATDTDYTAGLDGIHCWCKATQWYDSDVDMVGDLAGTKWVYAKKYNLKSGFGLNGIPLGCAEKCANFCGEAMTDTESIRTTVLSNNTASHCALTSCSDSTNAILPLVPTSAPASIDYIDWNFNNDDYGLTWVENGVTTTIYGWGVCISGDGVYDPFTNTISSSGAETNAWCNITKVNGQDVNSKWVLRGYIGPGCGTTDAAARCAEAIRDDLSFRQTMFESVQQWCGSCPSGYHVINGTSGPECELNQICPAGFYTITGLTPPLQAGTYLCPTSSNGGGENSWCQGILSEDATAWAVGYSTGEARGVSDLVGGTCRCKLTSWQGSDVMLIGNNVDNWVDIGISGYCPYVCSNNLYYTQANDNWVFQRKLFGAVSCAECPVASDFYTGSTGTTVPSVDNGNINSAANSQAITACYANGNTPFHDATGVFTFSSNCN